MKIAIIADVHGNQHALDAILNDIVLEKPDKVIGAGDIIGYPFPQSASVWRTFQTRGLETVMGNQEEYIVNYFAADEESYLRRDVRLLPKQFIARLFDVADAAEMAKLPASITIKGPQGRDVYICHASPRFLNRSFSRWLDDMADDLLAVKAAVIVGGHLHTPWQKNWRGKQLLMAGSAGLPFSGKPNLAEYLVLEFRQGNWQERHKQVAYDGAAALKGLQESNFLEFSGPFGWLMYDEVLAQFDHFSLYQKIETSVETHRVYDALAHSVVRYLQKVNRWDVVSAHLAARGIDFPLPEISGMNSAE